MDHRATVCQEHPANGPGLPSGAEADAAGVQTQPGAGPAQELGRGKRAVRVALDTPTLGTREVLDTYNLILATIRQLALGLARAERQPQLRYAQEPR